MAQFEGTLYGNGEAVSRRTGSKKTGLQAKLIGRTGNLLISIFVDKDDPGAERVVVAQANRSNTAQRYLYRGPLAPEQDDDQLLMLARFSENEAVRSAYDNLMVATKLAHADEIA